jgi:hypothetical protein
MAATFRVEDAKLVVSDEERHEVLFCGRPSAEPVLRLIGQWSDFCVVLLAPDYGPMSRPFENLVSCGADGEIRWRAALPDLGSDCYIDARVVDGKIEAHSWSCWLIQFDPFDGRLLSKVFTK